MLGGFRTRCWTRAGRWFLGLLALGAGCARDLDTESASAGALVSDCVVPAPADVAAWPAPASIAYADGALWLFESVTTASGSIVPGAAAWLPSAADACAGRIDLVRGVDGLPVSLLALDAAEESANAQRTDGRRLTLAPTTGFTDGSRAFVYYDHLLVGTGPFDLQRLGTGLCVMESRGAPCVRVAGDSGSTVLWLGDELAVRSAFLDQGTAHLLACRQPAALEASCTLARVAPGDAGRPAAYEHFDALRGWVANRAQATAVLHDLGAASLSFNPHHGRYTALLTDPFEGRVSLRVASALSQPFGDRLPLFDAAPPPPGELLGGGDELPPFRSAGGQVIVVAYAAGRAAARELHLASFRFHGVVQ